MSRTGTVVLAQEQSSGALYAVKYLSADVYEAPGFAYAYRREAARLLGLEHDALATVFEYVEQDGSAAVIEEFVDGVSLRRLLGPGVLDTQAALFVVKSALAGLAAAHQQQLVHRDVRPENILVNRDLTVKVTDFGVPLPPGFGSGILGSPHHRAPEIWQGQSPSPATDVFAAASTLVECLTGEAAMAAGGKPVGFAVVTGGDGTPMLPDGLPEPIAALAERCLAASPDDRPADADAMLDALRLAATKAYGEQWESAARAALAARIAATPGPTAADPQAGRRRRLPRWLSSGEPTAMSRRRASWALTASVAAAVISIGLVMLILAPSRDPNKLTSVAIPGPAVGGSASAAPVSDTTDPDQVTGVKVTSRSESAVTIDWDEGSDDVGVTGYIVQRDGATVGTPATPGFTDKGLKANTAYTYTVVAVDAAGNQSDPSDAVTATTLAGPDTAPPSVPTGLHATAHTETTVTLTWSAAKDNAGVAGYVLYRNGHQIATVVRPGFRDTGLRASTTYSYQVRAYDASGNSSVLSATVKVTTSKAPATPKPTKTAPPPPTTTPPPAPTTTPPPTATDTPSGTDTSTDNTGD